MLDIATVILLGEMSWAVRSTLDPSLAFGSWPLKVTRRLEVIANELSALSRRTAHHVLPRALWALGTDHEAEAFVANPLSREVSAARIARQDGNRAAKRQSPPIDMQLDHALA
jgi:hypothetical protein